MRKAEAAHERPAAVVRERPAAPSPIKDEDLQVFKDLFSSEDEGSKSSASEDEEYLPQASGKAKARSTGETRSEVDTRSKVDCEAGEAGPEAKAKAKGKSKAQGNGKAKAKAQARDMGTFAGRRPPTNPAKRARFDELKAHYLQAHLDTKKSEEEVSSTKTKVSKKPRKFSENQEKYWKSMQVRMVELANAGVAGADRMRIAAADWKANTLVEDEPHPAC